MNITQAIQIRRSRRTYLDTPIESSKIFMLKSRIDEYNLKSGLTIRFLENGSFAFAGFRKSYGMFKGVRSLLVMKGPARDPALREKIGYYGELLVLECTALGLGTCWVGGTFDAAGIRTGADEELVCVITLGYAPEDPTVKERLLYKAIHRKTKSISEMAHAAGDLPPWMRTGLKAVQKAPSTRNTHKVLFLYNAPLLRASVPDTCRFDLVDLGIAKLHFELATGGKFEPGNGGRYFPAKRE